MGLYCYLDLRVAIAELGLRVMFSKTAQVVLVENYVPPQALCLTRKSPAEDPTACPVRKISSSHVAEMLTKAPIKEVGKIFKASRLLLPRPTSGPATSLLATIAETEQPILIDDDEDARMDPPVQTQRPPRQCMSRDVLH